MERMGTHRAAEPSVRQGLVVLKGFVFQFYLNSVEVQHPRPPPSPHRACHKAQPTASFPCDHRSDCLLFIGERPQRWAPSAALNKEGLPGSCCLLLQVNVSSCFRVWLRMAPSQELLFYPASSVIGRDPVTHTPNPVFLVGDTEEGCVCE